MSRNPALNRPVGRHSAQGDLIQEFFIEEAFRGEYSGTNLIYAGFARPGAGEGDNVWQISKIAYDGSSNPISITWPQSDRGAISNDYEFSWTDRATYVYA
jgi:YD repeat-containing protein